MSQRQPGEFPIIEESAAKARQESSSRSSEKRKKEKQFLTFLISADFSAEEFCIHNNFTCLLQTRHNDDMKSWQNGKRFHTTPQICAR